MNEVIVVVNGSPSRRWPRGATAWFGALCLMTLCLGCTSDEEKITKVIQAHLEACQKAEGPIAEVEIFDGSKEPILKQACEQSVTELVVDSGVTATAKTGPYAWSISQHPDSGLWVVSGLSWSDFHNALAMLEDDDDPDAATLQGAAEQMAAAQLAFPQSPLVREHHLALLLATRKKTRSKTNQEDLAGIGPQAQAYYDELLGWSEQQEHAELSAKARVMVIEYLKDYEEFLAMSKGTIGGRDDVLETAIREAERSNDAESAAAYREELEASLAERPGQIKTIEDREELVRARICKELAGLDPQHIKEDALKTRAVALLSATTCEP